MTAIDTVDLNLGERGYAIRVGAGLLQRLPEELSDLAEGRTAVVVVDRAIRDLHLGPVADGLRRIARAVHVIEVPSGESAKSFPELQALLDAILALGIDRRTLIVALGGGVTGDLAGFAAAVTLRGLDFVQLPTTLLAQVDSSVGGKTGINTAHGKNLVGAFHQPRRVLIDTAVLDTLPRRELLAGYAEVVKYGAIGDHGFFEWLEANGARLIEGDPEARRQAIVESCRAKAAVVAADEREAGNRALLNFGHTFGHALEAMAGYDGSLLHGEAVAIGMVLAARMSTRVGTCPGQEAERLARHLSAVGLPTALDDADPGRTWSADALLAHMRKDKKVRDGRLTFVLLERIGRAILRNDLDAAAPHALLDRPRAA